MTLPNMKTFVLASVKPLIWSLKCFYDNQVKYMEKLVRTQNVAITETNSQITELQKNINDLGTIVTKNNSELADIQSNSYTAEQVKELADRNRALEYICGALYDKVYELLETGKVEDPTLPDYDDPFGENVTDEELEIRFRNENGIPLDAELTEEQRVALEEYITNYRNNLPG